MPSTSESVFKKLYFDTPIYFIFRILFNEPSKSVLDLETKPLINVIPSDPLNFAPKLKKYLNDKNKFESPIFIIGNWGSGKTHRVLVFKKDYEKKYRFRYKSFFSINNLDEAYSNLIGNFSKLLAFSVLLAFNVWWLFFDDSNEHNTLSLISIIFSYGFFINKLKIFYVIFNLIDSFCLKTKVTIIDDLDRSSLSESDQWAMLSNLWHRNHKYIVLLGYVDNNDKGAIIEKVEKLNGEFIFLKNSDAINCRLALKKENDPEFPFEIESKNIDWLNYISPRDLIRIILEVKEDSKDMESMFKIFLYLTKFIEQISYNLKLDFVDRENITFGGHNTFDERGEPSEKMLRFNTKPTEKSPPLAPEKVKDIYDSLKPEIRELIKNFYTTWLRKATSASDFPTMFKYEMNKRDLKLLYDFRESNPNV